jgi:hypothetical protein
MISIVVLQTDNPIDIKVRTIKQYLEIDGYKLYGVRFLEELNSRDNMYLCACAFMEETVAE